MSNHQLVVLGFVLCMAPPASAETFSLAGKVYESQQEFVASGRRCGTPTPSLSTRRRVNSSRNAFLRFNPDFPSETRKISVPVRFHVLHDGERGKVSRERLQRQLDVMNQAFADHGVEFTEKAVIYHDDARWFRMEIDSAEERDAKSRLGRDPEYALNFYTAEPASGELGWATWPWHLRGDPDVDGVVVLHSAVPGGDPPFDEGDTGVHEVGHWLGLFHTFDGWDPDHAPAGGCRAPGDEVGDTPAEGSPSFGPGVGVDCPAAESRDTCPNEPGKDPIRNYMDYADDRCMDHFTDGQRVRLQAETAQYRPLLLSESVRMMLQPVPPE